MGIGEQPSEPAFLSQVNCRFEVLNRLRFITLCSCHGPGCDESLRFLDVFLPCLGLSDDLVAEIFGGVELSHAAKCLEPAFVDNELVSGIGNGGCDLERFVEISEGIVVGTHLYESVSNGS